MNEDSAARTLEDNAASTSELALALTPGASSATAPAVPDTRALPVAGVFANVRSLADLQRTLAGASNNQRGAAFETLVAYELRTSSVYGFKDVWSTAGRQVPRRVLEALDLQPGDLQGVDFIGETDAGEFVAVQAKWHQDENRPLAQDEVSGLTATLRGRSFLYGLLFTTAVSRSEDRYKDVQFRMWGHWNAKPASFWEGLAADTQGAPPKAPDA